MKNYAWLVCVCALVSASHSVASHEDLEKASFAARMDGLVSAVNNDPLSTWTAERYSRFETLADIQQLLGARFESNLLKQARRPTVNHTDKHFDLPENFNAADKWPRCKTIRQIRDQSSCGSCWSFGAVTAMSDRVCIASGQKLTNIQLSARDLLSCCKDCGFGCRGGWVGPPWDFWKEQGIVTGGDEGTTDTCMPYPFPKCDHHSKEVHYGPCAKPRYATPQCVSECSNIKYKKKYLDDKIKSKTSYNLEPDELTIQKEIFVNGPVEAAFNVYEDFGIYKEGIYQHKTGKLIGGHAVRIVGWGVQDKIKYWLIANSWNENWGEKGFFRILRGKNHVGIEGDVAAGTM